MKLHTAVAPFLALVIAACADDSPTPDPGPEAPAKNPAKEAPAANPAGTTSPTAPATATDPKPAIKAPTSTLCADQVKDRGDKVIFCADFDDARELSGWRNGVFEENVFEKDETGGAKTALTDGWLIIDKPNDAKSARFTSTIMKGAKMSAFTIDFDVKVTAGSGSMNRFFALSGPITVDGNDNDGKPVFFGRDDTTHPYAYGSPQPLPDRRHIQLSFAPGAVSTAEGLHISVEDHLLKNDVSSSSVTWLDGQDLKLDLMGAGADGATGDATFEFDNVLVVAE